MVLNWVCLIQLHGKNAILGLQLGSSVVLLCLEHGYLQERVVELVSKMTETRLGNDLLHGTVSCFNKRSWLSGDIRSLLPRSLERHW